MLLSNPLIRYALAIWNIYREVQAVLSLQMSSVPKVHQEVSCLDPEYISLQRQRQDGGEVPRLAHKSPFNPQCVGILERTVLHWLCAHNGTVELEYLDGKPSRVGSAAVSSHLCGHSKEPGGEQKRPLRVQNRCCQFSWVLAECQVRKRRNFC